MANAVRVIGVQDLMRAFNAADRHVRDDLRDALEEAAAPVRADAQSLAASRIRNVHEGDPWSRMRTGVYRAVAYVAPVERGAKGRGNQRLRRRKFADLMMSRAMEPALERNRDKVAARVDDLLDEVANVWERT